ncbi:UNKNOWN [Stylonychia lemnae]|uniref:Uncharacterized protein n=1 Tax=Stylonychia lemnae TaxID=5949 RepID=A0A078ASF5_STYLE|nr:UNKNOWN [Stylonychia lemnae]|eukprot:CDW85375.1 UNKNOWN [Stylonychia lemnae]
MLGYIHQSQNSMKQGILYMVVIGMLDLKYLPFQAFINRINDQLAVHSLAVKKTNIFAGMFSQTEQYVVKVNPVDAIDRNNDVYTLQNDQAQSNQKAKILKINNALDSFQWRIDPYRSTNVYHLQEIQNGNLLMACGNEYTPQYYLYIKFYNLDGSLNTHYQYEPSIGQTSTLLQGVGLINVVYNSTDQSLIGCYRSFQTDFFGYIIQETSAFHNLHTNQNVEQMLCVDIHQKGNKIYTVYHTFSKSSIDYYSTSDLISRLYFFGDATINGIASSYIFKMRSQEYCYNIIKQETNLTPFNLDLQLYQILQNVPTTTTTTTTTTTPAPNGNVVTITTTTSQPDNNWPSSYNSYSHDSNSYSHDSNSYSHDSNSYDSNNGLRILDQTGINSENDQVLRQVLLLDDEELLQILDSQIEREQEDIDSVYNQEMLIKSIKKRRQLQVVDILNTNPISPPTDISTLFSFDIDLRSILVELNATLLVNSPNKTTCNRRGVNDLRYLPNIPDKRDFNCYSELENCTVSMGYYQFGQCTDVLNLTILIQKSNSQSTLLKNKTFTLSPLLMDDAFIQTNVQHLSQQNYRISALNYDGFNVLDPAKNFTLPMHTYTPNWCKYYSQHLQVSKASKRNLVSIFIPQIFLIPSKNLIQIECSNNSLADHYEYYINSDVSYGGYVHYLTPYKVDIYIFQYIKYKNGYDSPPFFINMPTMTMIQVGDNQIYQLPAIFDIQNDLYDIKIDLGKASLFTKIKDLTNLVISPSLYDRGKYDVKIKLIQKNQQSLFNTYSFKISVYSDKDDINYLEENRLDNYDRIKRQVKDQTLRARVLKINQIGEVVILFDKIMAIPYNYTQVMNESLSLKLVQDNVVTNVDYNITKFKGQKLYLKLFFRVQKDKISIKYVTFACLLNFQLDQLRIMFKENKYYIDSKNIYSIFSTIQGATKYSLLAIFGSNIAINIFMYNNEIILFQQEMWSLFFVGNDR